ncbi:hypothetical protein LPB67_14455 [Undibacterium sp. Jales W-56]|uniref:hypothetical protein n=1 Tax=Undibacterium sp. Jales W-56 TaxID=2897325 RepID=UPI0021D303D1|nr:hypothetical protein [Undibacterium sp. Jales W-56]MCU6434975.1 hypothetical protein [Undibacterium sp. Jales W-56]
MLNIVKNEIRSLLNIRQERALPPAGGMPTFGSTIVLNRLKIQLRMTLEPEQWEWLTLKGWRTQDMRKNRRKYFKVPSRAVARLLHATPEDREEIYQRIVTYAYDDSQLS